MYEHIVCALSGLNIERGDEFGVLLLKSNNPAQFGIEYDPYEDFAVFETTTKYVPFCAPFYGTLDWSNKFTLSESTPTSEMLETIFDRPMTKIMDMVGSGREITSIFSDLYTEYVDAEIIKKLQSENNFNGELSDYEKKDVTRANTLVRLAPFFYLKEIMDPLLEESLETMYKPLRERNEKGFEAFVKETKEHQDEFQTFPNYFSPSTDLISRRIAITRDYHWAPIFKEYCNIEDLRTIELMNVVMHSLNKFYTPSGISDGADNLSASIILHKVASEIAARYNEDEDDYDDDYEWEK